MVNDGTVCLDIIEKAARNHQRGLGQKLAFWKGVVFFDSGGKTVNYSIIFFLYFSTFSASAVAQTVIVYTIIGQLNRPKYGKKESVCVFFTEKGGESIEHIMCTSLKHLHAGGEVDFTRPGVNLLDHT